MAVPHSRRVADPRVDRHLRDALAEPDLKGLEPVRQQLPDHLWSAVVGGNERADADVDVGIHGQSVEYNPVSGKICIWTQSDLKSE